MEMIEGLFLGIIGFLLVIIVLRMISWRKYYTEMRESRNKYKLYRVRDELISLVASGSIREDDKFFGFYYRVLNECIIKQNKFNFKNLVRSMTNAINRDRSERIAQTLREELQNYDNDVKSTIADFYLALRDIVIENSIILRTIKKISDKNKATKFLTQKCYKTSEKIFPKDSNNNLNAAYRVYDYSNNALGQLS